MTSWNGVFVPKGTPKEVIETMGKAMHEVLATPEVKEQFAKVGVSAKASSPDEPMARLTADIKRWNDVVDKAGIPTQVVARVQQARELTMSDAARGYPDLHEHLAGAGEARPACSTIDRPIDKDAEMHPLVRWQFVGGMEEAQAQGVSVHQHRRRARAANTTCRWWSAPSPPIRKSTASAWTPSSRTSRPSGITPSPIRSSRGWSTRRPATRS